MIAGALLLDLPTVLSGSAAAMCLALAPAFRSRRTLLLLQLVAGLCFAIYYICLDLPVAAAANVLGAAQTVAALLSAKNAAMGRTGYALIGLMALFGLWFWQGPISALSVVAQTLVAIARMQTNALHLRGLLLAGGCFWTLHDFAGEAWIALAADVGAVLVGTAALLSLLFRVTVEWRPRTVAPAVAAA